MFTWTEFGLVIGVGFVIAGKKDLPNAAHWAGTRLGRLVGFIQGAKARADRYTQQNELRALQNELRSGLRELDAVRAEMAQTFTRPMGRDLGTTVPGANRTKQSFAAGAASALAQGGTGATLASAPQNPAGEIPSDPTSASSAGLPPQSLSSTSAALPLPQSHVSSSDGSNLSVSGHANLAPTKHTIGAIAEEEWSRQGIGFKSKAEMGSGLPEQSYDHTAAGSTVLSNLLQQSLIFDQYDRVTQKQDELIRGKMDSIQRKVQKESREKIKDHDDPSKAQ